MLISNDDYIAEIIDEAPYVLDKFTLQLYLYVEGKPPIPLSSSVLIKTYQNHYLLTAAHVIKENPINTVFVLNPGSGGITLSGECISSEIAKNEVSNRTDIAVIKLNHALMEPISKLKKEFFDITTYNLDYYSREDFYLIYGYPVSKTKRIGSRKTIQSRPFNFLTGITDIPIKEIDRPWTIQMMFTKNRIIKLKTGERIKAPNPVGLSGCGLWSLEQILYQKEDKPRFQLKGILIEYERDRSILVCTKMNIICQLLINKFKEPLPGPKSLANYDIS